jgi:hypothetical protein
MNVPAVLKRKREKTWVLLVALNSFFWSFHMCFYETIDVKHVKGFLSKQVPMVQTFKCIFVFCKFPFIIRHILQNTGDWKNFKLVFLVECQTRHVYVGRIQVYDISPMSMASHFDLLMQRYHFTVYVKDPLKPSSLGFLHVMLTEVLVNCSNFKSTTLDGTTREKEKSEHLNYCGLHISFVLCMGTSAKQLWKLTNFVYTGYCSSIVASHKRIIEIIGQHNTLITHKIQTEMLLKYC